MIPGGFLRCIDALARREEKYGAAICGEDYCAMCALALLVLLKDSRG